MQLYLEFCTRLKREGGGSMSLKVPDVEQIEFDDIAQLHPIAFKLPYIRSEKNGYFSLLGNDGVLDYTIINETSNEIFSLCTGENTVNDILDIICNEYNISDKDVVKNDIKYTLAKFSSIKALTWVNPKYDEEFDNSIVSSLSEDVSNEYSISLLQERDLPIASNLISESQVKTDRTNYINYSWSPNPLIYSDTIDIRQSMFNYTRDYFLVEHQNKPCGIILIDPDKDANLNIAQIKFMYAPKECLSSVFKSIVEFYKGFSIKKISLLRMLVYQEREIEDKQFIKTLSSLGFVKMSTYIDSGYKSKTLVEFCLTFGDYHAHN